MYVCTCVIFDGGDQKIPQITNAQWEQSETVRFCYSLKKRTEF